MRKGFTMIELLTAMSIMALLGVAASNGYALLTRGIRERSSIAAASALLKSAAERAAVDRTKTIVYCYNRLLEEKEASGSGNATVVGVMTAIVRGGRLSRVASGGKFLYDEFGDINVLYPAFSEDENYSSDSESHNLNNLNGHSGMRLWKFAEGSGQLEYSVVADTVWCSPEEKETIFEDPIGVGETNCLMSCFVNQQKSGHEPSWRAGDAYGIEIGEVQLPRGYVFGQTIPNNFEDLQMAASAFVFDGTGSAVMPARTIDIWSTKPDGSGSPKPFKKAGVATSQRGREAEM